MTFEDNAVQTTYKTASLLAQMDHQQSQMKKAISWIDSQILNPVGHPTMTKEEYITELHKQKANCERFVKNSEEEKEKLKNLFTEKGLGLVFEVASTIKEVSCFPA